MTWTAHPFALPLSSADRARIEQLVADGYHQRVQGNVVVLRRRGDDADVPSALAALVGARPARALVAAGLDTVDAARQAAEADPDALAATDGIGPATLAKLRPDDLPD